MDWQQVKSLCAILNMELSDLTLASLCQNNFSNYGA